MIKMNVNNGIKNKTFKDDHLMMNFFFKKVGKKRKQESIVNIQIIKLQTKMKKQIQMIINSVFTKICDKISYFYTCKIFVHLCFLNL